MEAVDDRAKTSQRPATGPLISRTTVLIMGALLIGLTVGNVVRADLQMQAFAAGAVGIIAFLGFTWIGSLKHRRHRRKIVSELEARVDHHIHAAE